MDRALGLLDELAAAEGLTLSDLAARLGLAVSTTHRLLAALAQRRMAETDAATGRWFVGPGAFRLGAAFLRRAGLAERAGPILRDLVSTSGETAALAVADGDGALIVAEAPGVSQLRAVLTPGTRLPLHASALGKALIAHLPLGRVETLLGRGAAEALTPATLTDQGALTADLATIRHAGFALDRQEGAAGLVAVAAPVFGGLGEPVAALGLSGPAARLTPGWLNDTGGPAVAAAAAALGRALGGR